MEFEFQKIAIAVEKLHIKNHYLKYFLKYRNTMYLTDFTKPKCFILTSHLSSSQRNLQLFTPLHTNFSDMHVASSQSNSPSIQPVIKMEQGS